MKAEKPARNPNCAWYMYVMIPISVEISDAVPTYTPMPRLATR